MKDMGSEMSLQAVHLTTLPFASLGELHEVTADQPFRESRQPSWLPMDYSPEECCAHSELEWLSHCVLCMLWRQWVEFDQKWRLWPSGCDNVILVISQPAWIITALSHADCWMFASLEWLVTANSGLLLPVLQVKVSGGKPIKVIVMWWSRLVSQSALKSFLQDMSLLELGSSFLMNCLPQESICCLRRCFLLEKVAGVLHLGNNTFNSSCESILWCFSCLADSFGRVIDWEVDLLCETLQHCCSWGCTKTQKDYFMCVSIGNRILFVSEQVIQVCSLVIYVGMFGMEVSCFGMWGKRGSAVKPSKLLWFVVSLISQPALTSFALLFVCNLAISSTCCGHSWC